LKKRKKKIKSNNRTSFSKITVKMYPNSTKMKRKKKELMIWMIKI
jgi:hypothetical protein